MRKVVSSNIRREVTLDQPCERTAEREPCLMSARIDNVHSNESINRRPVQGWSDAKRKIRILQRLDMDIN